MSNFGTMYLYELRKIFGRKLTIIVLSLVTLIMIAMNIGEYVAGEKLINTKENDLSGREVNETLLNEMRLAVDPKIATMEDGETVSIGISVKDETYEPLMDYLYTLGGNFDKAYNMTEEKLYSTFDGVINTDIAESYLTENEKAYWAERRAENPDRLVYGKLRNGWGDSVTIMYVVSLLTLISVAATLSGVFSEETSLKTDALVFSSVNGRKKLVYAKILAGVSAGLAETLILLVACAGTEFAVSGFGGAETSVQFFVGPTAMDMKIGTAFMWYAFIMLIIGILLSVMAMCLSQVFRNSIAVVAVMMFMWLLSMFNIPERLGLLARIWNFFPVTFLGSWTFTDYHLVPFFGARLTIIEAAPIVYLCLSVVFIVIAKISYDKYQVKGR